MNRFVSIRRTAARRDVTRSRSCFARSVFAQNTPEIEPNETKGTATVVLAPMAPGHTLTGNTTGSATTAGATSLDTFRVKTAPAAAGIYRYRLVLTTTGPVGHVGSIRGLTQSSLAQAPWSGSPGGTAVASETAAHQTSLTTTTPARFVQWYGFGLSEEIYYRVTGVAATTADYVATLDRAPITPQDVGTYAPGFVTIWTFG